MSSRCSSSACAFRRSQRQSVQPAVDSLKLAGIDCFFDLESIDPLADFPERIREGVRRLAGVLEAEMELRETFGATGPIPTLPRSGYDSPGTDLS